MVGTSTMVAMALALSALPVGEHYGRGSSAKLEPSQSPTRCAEKLAAAQAKRDRKAVMRAAKAATP